MDCSKNPSLTTKQRLRGNHGAKMNLQWDNKSWLKRYIMMTAWNNLSEDHLEEKKNKNKTIQNILREKCLEAEIIWFELSKN